MSRIDWSKAPKDTQRCYMYPNGEPMYMRKVNGRVFKYMGHNSGVDMWADCGLSNVYSQWICAQRDVDGDLFELDADTLAVMRGEVVDSGTYCGCNRAVVDEIDNTVTQRGERYGLFADGAVIMQDLKTVMRATPGWERLTPSQREALEMI